MSSAARATVPPVELRAFVPLAALHAVRIPATARTLEGFRAWSHSETFPEYGRITFVAGEIIIDMSGEEITTHVWLKTEVARVLANLNVEQQLGIMHGDGTQVVNEAADLSNIPDAVFVTWESLESGRVQLAPRPKKPEQSVELTGTPDLVVEIVSDSSVEKDPELLRQAYHKAGIPEYWLIDGRGDKIDFQVLHHRRTGYAAAPERGGWRRSRVFGRSFRLERTRGRLNQWVYRLHVQPST
jgi:Uma2 family endonuclease